MMKVVVLFAFACGVALALNEPLLVRNQNPETLQEKVLTKQATGNFACKVNTVTVVTENPGENSVVQASHVRGAFQSVATLEWAHAPQMSFSALDGRISEKVLGTPGGDMGEFIQAIMAYAKVAKADLSQEDVDSMFVKYLKTMNREKFTYMTDEKAYIKLAIATGCRNLRIADMGGMKRKKETLLAQIGNPEFIGDPFISFLAANGTDLDLDTRYIGMGLTAYHKVLWNGPLKLSNKLCYLETKGMHREAAFVDVTVPSYCIDQGLVPMVSQQMTCTAPVFVRHPDAAKLLRRELVAVLTEGQGDRVSPNEVLANFNQITENNFDSFKGTLPGKAAFSVSFSLSSPILEQ
jgi:hypothetical protein